jgi:hypothetical protein
MEFRDGFIIAAMGWWKCSVWGALLLGGFFTTGYLCRIPTRGFALGKISSSICGSPEWNTEPLRQEQKEEVERALSQPYRFLSKGAQAFVFLSADERYVIKFFKLHHLQPSLWVRVLHWPWRTALYPLEKRVEKRRDLVKTFTSYKIAYEQLREKTGMLFLHLNKSDNLKRKLCFSDPLGIVHAIDLDQMEFFVQRYARPFLSELERYIAQGEREKVNRVLSGLVALLVSRNQEGIFDKDPDIKTNFGILNTEAMQIDVGRFSRDNGRKERAAYSEEIRRITDGLNHWLRERDPALSIHLQEEIAKL